MWIAGGVTLAFNLAQLGFAIVPAIIEKVTGNSAPNLTYSGSDSRVVSTDATHIVLRPGLAAPAPSAAGDTDTYVVDPATKFDFRGPAWRQQTRPAGLDWLKPGRQVRIDYVMKNREKLATLVTIWVEQPEG